MSADDKDIQGRLERIRTRVDNWERGEGYRPSELPQDVPVHDVIFLLKHIGDLEVEAREKNAWEGRYNALLEECENSRPREYAGNGSDLPYGTVVVDREGESWQRDGLNGWYCISMGGASELSAKYAPYAIVYTPKEES